VEAVRVPQHLDLEDVVAWGLSATDLVFTVGGAALAWWLYLVTPGPLLLRVIVAAPAALAGLALGVPRLAERPLRQWLWIALAFALRPRLFVSGERA
jgi:hypothetical protein